VSPVRYELGPYVTEDDILHSHRRENLKSYTVTTSSQLNKTPSKETTPSVAPGVVQLAIAG
jgi:hypothetical protein